MAIDEILSTDYGEPTARGKINANFADINARVPVFSFGTLASRPASPTVPTIYYASDSPITSVWDGDSWAQFVEGRQVTVPAVADFTATGTGSEVATGGGILTTSAAGQTRLYKKNLSAGASRRLEMGFLATLPPANYGSITLRIFEAGGKSVGIGVQFSTSFVLAFQKFNADGSFNANYASPALPSGIRYLALQYDASNVLFMWSVDGRAWSTYTQTVASWLGGAPTIGGFGVDGPAATYSTVARIVHYADVAV